MKSDINSKQNTNSDQVVLSRAEFEAFLDTFNNLQIYSTRAASFLRRYQSRPLPSETQPAQRPTTPSDNYARAASTPAVIESTPAVIEPAVSRTSRTRIDSLEGNGAEEQWNLRKKDTVRIINQVRIGKHYLEDSEQIGPVQYFTDRFVVVSICYFRGRTQYHRLVKREIHNVRLVARHRNTTRN